MRYVVVEDEIRIREGLRKLLAKLDPENRIVGEAENGEEGLELIRREKPDVVITDVRMPLMDGLKMLEQLYAEECSARAIVLSAYSEFEYARTAMRMGVTEYLLKPIAIADLSEAIERIKNDLEKDKKRKPNPVGSLKQVVKGILNGDLAPDGDVAEYLEREFGIQKQMPWVLFVAYFEEWTQRKRTEFIGSLKQILAEKPMIASCFLEDEKRREIRLLLYGYTDKHHVKRWIQAHFLQKSVSDDGIAMGWTQAQGIYALKERCGELERYLEWNILLGDDIIISYPEIRHIQTAVCVYPLEIENQMKTAVCTNDPEKIEKSIAQFREYFYGQKMYEPKEVKECYVRFFLAAIHFAQEIGNLNFEELNQRELLDQIMHTRTRQGLKKITDSLAERLKKQEKEIENLNVKRAVAMIHEFYQTGITLDEIAMKMGITPEYLGTQFHQVMGVNFSAYVKTFRINKAKELLVGTQLKIYEIAQQTGYSDPKYFGKVFKAQTGQLPADYRRMHK